MGHRFVYDTITPQEFRESLKSVEVKPGEFGMKPGTFSRLTGIRDDRIRQMLDDRNDRAIPYHVVLILNLFNIGPEVVDEARRVAGEFISADTLWPEHGEYPYLGGRDETDT